MKPISLFAFFIVLFNACLTPEKLAERCAETFPCTDSLAVVERTITDTIEYAGTEIQYIDTIECPPSLIPHTLFDTLVVKVPGTRIYVQRTVKDSTFWRRDTAYFAALAGRLKKTEAENLRLKADIKNAVPFKIPFWVWLLVAGLLALLGIRRKK